MHLSSPLGALLCKCALMNFLVTECTASGVGNVSKEKGHYTLVFLTGHITFILFIYLGLIRHDYIIDIYIKKMQIHVVICVCISVCVVTLRNYCVLKASFHTSHCVLIGQPVQVLLWAKLCPYSYTHCIR